MGVNVAAFLRYVVRDGQRTMSFVVPPVVGFLLCGYLWLNLGRTAILWGFTWSALGFLYGLWVRRTSGKLSLGDMSEG
jgi:hypothetical protein